MTGTLKFGATGTESGIEGVGVGVGVDVGGGVWADTVVPKANRNINAANAAFMPIIPIPETVLTL